MLHKTLASDFTWRRTACVVLELGESLDTPLPAVAQVGYVFKDRGAVHVRRTTLTVAATVSYVSDRVQHTQIFTAE